MYAVREDNADERGDEGYGEDEFKAVVYAVDVESDHGGDGGGEVVAQAVEAYAFGATCAVGDVDGYGSVADTGCGKGYAVSGAYDGKHG